MTKQEKTPPWHVLLVYDNSPESVDLYLIPETELDKAGWEMLTLCHNKMVNGDELTKREEIAASTLACALAEVMEHVAEDRRGSRWACQWAKYKQDRTKPLRNVVVTHVFRSGFFL